MSRRVISVRLGATRGTLTSSLRLRFRPSLVANHLRTELQRSQLLCTHQPQTLTNFDLELL